MKAGSIINWAGAVENIPAQWVLCDGNNGTPDLRDRFVIGAGNSFAVGANGGNATHEHTFTATGHHHDLEEVEMDEVNDGDYIESKTSTELVTGTTDGKTERPPYYSLCYIMYLGGT